jgi:hypothetical protein
LIHASSRLGSGIRWHAPEFGYNRIKRTEGHGERATSLTVKGIAACVSADLAAPQVPKSDPDESEGSGERNGVHPGDDAYTRRRSSEARALGRINTLRYWL